MEHKLKERKELRAGKFPAIVSETISKESKEAALSDENKDSISQRGDKLTSETLDSYFEKFIHNITDKQSNIKPLEE